MIEYITLGETRYNRFVSEPSAVYVRAPHDTERYNVNTDNYTYIHSLGIKGAIRGAVTQNNTSLPEVYRFYPFHSVLLTYELQWLWRNINPELSADKWSTLMSDDLAWCNGTGIGGDEPRANYVLGKNLDAKPVAFDQVRFCGGAIFKASISDGIAWIETISASNPPSAAHVLANKHLWYWGTSISPSGNIYYINRMGTDGALKHVRVPIITSRPVYLPVSEVHVLPEGFWPEPTWTHYQ